MVTAANAEHRALALRGRKSINLKFEDCHEFILSYYGYPFIGNGVRHRHPLVGHLVRSSREGGENTTGTPQVPRRPLSPIAVSGGKITVQMATLENATADIFQGR